MTLARRLAAETVGTLFLTMTVTGTGLMAARLTDDAGLMLLANAVATGAMLTVLITLIGPSSGAHFNPVVTLANRMQGQVSTWEAIAYGTAQIAGAVAGTLIAHAMFEVPLLQLSQITRSGGGQWLAEFVTSFGLVWIAVDPRLTQKAAPIGLYVAAAYWFTSSTAFGNPALALARAFTEGLPGIRPADVPAFALAELAGAVAAVVAAKWFNRRPVAG